jgi:polyisoprenyl-teichoic acid--peptidoglycan teichoic acid transferase
MRLFKSSLLFCILILAALIFISPGLISARSSSEKATPSGASRVVQLVEVPQGATPTPTPFQPLPPTPTYLPEVEALSVIPKSIKPAKNNEDNPWDSNPVPTIPPGTRINLLLLGSDKRPYEGGFRTDTIILVSLDPTAGTASLVSFPRDLYIYIPGWIEQRINTAMGYGGFPLLADTLEYNFGVRPTYYVMVNFFAFEQTIDSLGGIDVYASQPLTDHRDGHGYYTVSTGLNHMDGETALWYSRSRYSTSDFDRTRRQQEVIMGLFDRLLSLNGVEKAPELYDIYVENVTTNMSWQDIAPLLPLAAQLSDTSRIQRYYVGPAQVTPWTTPGGAQVLLPNYDAISAVLWQALNGE